MQKFILPVGGLVMLAVLTGIALGIETGIRSGRDARQVVATGARCIGKGLVDGDRINSVTLKLICDRAGRRYTHTDDKENIKRYVSSPNTPFVCVVRKRDSADCVTEKPR